MYNGFIRVKTYDNPYCIEELKESKIKVNKDTLLEYHCLRQHDLFDCRTISRLDTFPTDTSLRTNPRLTLPQQTLPRRTVPQTDNSPTGHIPEGHFPDWTFPH